MLTSQVDEALPRMGLERCPISVESLSIAFSAVLSDEAKQPKEEELQDERPLPVTIADCLLKALTILTALAKVRSFVPHVAEQCVRTGEEGEGFALLLKESLSKHEKEIQKQQQQQQQQQQQEETPSNKDQKLRPELKVGGLSADLFVPTQEIERAVRSCCFLLERGVGVLVRGNRACGKSTVVRKALGELSSVRTVSLYLGGGKASFGTEDQVLVGAELLSPSSEQRRLVVLVEGFDPTSEAHVSYVLSLVQGRTIYSREKEDFVTMPKYCINGRESTV